jgi:hypothetical protein
VRRCIARAWRTRDSPSDVRPCRASIMPSCFRDAAVSGCALAERGSVLAHRAVRERLRLGAPIRALIREVREPHHDAGALSMRVGMRGLRHREGLAKGALGAGVVAASPQNGAEPLQRADQPRIVATRAASMNGDSFELIGLGAPRSCRGRRQCRRAARGSRQSPDGRCRVRHA